MAAGAAGSEGFPTPGRVLFSGTQMRYVQAREAVTGAGPSSPRNLRCAELADDCLPSWAVWALCGAKCVLQHHNQRLNKNALMLVMLELVRPLLLADCAPCIRMESLRIAASSPPQLSIYISVLIASVLLNLRTTCLRSSRQSHGHRGMHGAAADAAHGLTFQQLTDESSAGCVPLLQLAGLQSLS